MAENEGDGVSVIAAPDTVIGALAANANSGDSEIVVSPTVMSNLKIGYSVTITDGVHSETFMCGGLDTVNSVVKLRKIIVNSEPNPSLAYSYLAATPTTIMMSIPYTMTTSLTDPFVIIRGGRDYPSGTVAFGTTMIPANTKFRIRYKNNGVTAKKLYLDLQLFA